MKEKLSFDYSTINKDALNRLPIVKLPPTYRLQAGMGNGCFLDPPGYPTYFTQSVYTLRFSDEWRELEKAKIEQENKEIIERAAAIAIPDNHLAVIHVREFYPEVFRGSDVKLWCTLGCRRYLQRERRGMLGTVPQKGSQIRFARFALLQERHARNVLSQKRRIRP
jgi:hypothetical protein